MFRTRSEVLSYLRALPESVKLSASQQKKLHSLMPDMRCYMGTHVRCEIPQDKLVDLIRFLVNEEGWE